MDNKFNMRFNIWFSAVKQKAKQIKIETGALYLAYKRPDVPFYAKLVAVIVVSYALSPIDLIPDFIPVLGYLDDLVLLPIGIAFAIKLIPRDIMNECREQSKNIFDEGKPKNWFAGSIIIFIWLLLVIYFLIKIIKS